VSGVGIEHRVVTLTLSCEIPKYHKEHMCEG
jgi:hypothetical protein